MDTKLTDDLDNVLWVEEQILKLMNKGSIEPLCDLLRIVRSSLNESTLRKLERTLSEALVNTDKREFEEQIKGFGGIDFSLNTINLWHDNSTNKDSKMKNIQWEGKFTWGCTFGEFFFVVLGPKPQGIGSTTNMESLERFKELHRQAWQYVDFVRHDISQHLFDYTNFIHFIQTELQQLHQITVRNKCSCQIPSEIHDLTKRGTNFLSNLEIDENEIDWEGIYTRNR